MREPYGTIHEDGKLTHISRDAGTTIKAENVDM